MRDIPRKNLEEFISAAHCVAQHNLVICGSGNLSWRIDKGNMLITATGSWMGQLSPDEVALCTIADGVCLNGKTSSIEYRFHRAILHEYPDINVVLHFQSPHATALACSKGRKRKYAVIPEIPYYIGRVKEIPYMAPGSDALAEAVTGAIADHTLVVIRNHGQVVVGGTFKEALQRALFFEFACEIIVHTGNKAEVLSNEAVDFLMKARKKNV